VRVASCCVATETVFTLNVAELLPASTVTEAGTVAALLLLDSFTIMPPADATPDNVTVPVAPVSPTTLVGFTDSDTRLAGVITNLAFSETLP